MTKKLLHIDRSHLDFRLAALALVGVAVAAVIESIIGVDLLLVAIAALAVMAISGSGTLRARITHMLVFTLIGGAFAFISYVSSDTAWQAALVLGVVSYLTGLAYVISSGLGRAGYVLLLWTVAVLIEGAEGDDPPQVAAAFLVGGVAAMLVVAAAAGLRGAFGRGGDADVQEDSAEPAQLSGVRDIARSAVGMWSLTRAVLVMVAVVIGYQLTDDLDPFWTAIVLLVVFLPDSEDTIFKASQRGIGTLVGAATAAALFAATTSEPVIAVISLIATFGAIAFYSANYMIYAFCLTNAVVLYYRLAVGPDVSDAGLRLAAAIIGIALALGGTALISHRSAQRRQDTEQSPSAP